jgi:hypothetical protein
MREPGGNMGSAADTAVARMQEAVRERVSAKLRKRDVTRVSEIEPAPDAAKAAKIRSSRSGHRGGM